MSKYYIRLWFWCNVWLVAWLFALPFKKKGHENCLTYALKRLAKEEGYLVIRWARSAKHPALVWPHFLFLAAKDHVDLQHLVPKEEIGAKTMTPTIWFDGRELVGDSEDTDIKKDENK